MSTRLRSMLAGGLSALLALVVLAGAAFFWLATTRSGARWAFDRLGAGLPGRIEVEDIRGPLRGPLHLRHLHYQADTWELTVADLELDWELRRLPLGRIDVFWVRGDSVTIRTKPPAERAEEHAAQLPDVDLPLDLAIARARLTHVAWYRDSLSPPLLGDSLLVDRLDLRDTLRVARLVAGGPALAVALRGRLFPHGAWPLVVDGTWAWQPEGRPWIAGTGLVSGTLDTLHLDQRLERPWPATVRGRLFHAARDPAFDLATDFTGVRPRAFLDSFPAGTWSGAVRVTGRPSHFAVNGRFVSREAWWGPVDGTGSFALDGARWIFERLDLAVPGSALRATARGTFEPRGDGVAADVSARWRNFTWPTVPPPTQGWSSPSGSARLRGRLDRYHLVADGDLAVQRMPNSTWHVESEGGLRELEIARATSAFAGGDAQVRGHVAWAPRAHWEFTGHGTGLRTETIAASLPGIVAVMARTEGSAPPGGTARGTVTIDTLAGAVRGNPVSGTAAFTYAANGWTMTDGRLAMGSDSLVARGALLPRWDLDWRIAAPELASAVAGASGSLAGAGKLAGTPESPRIVADLEGDSLQMNGAMVEHLVLRGDLDPRAETTLDLSASGLRSGGGSLDSLTVTARGPRAQQVFTATAFRGSERLAVGIHGGGDLRAWSGTLDRVDLVSDVAGRWALASPAPLAHRAGRFTLQDARWVSGGSAVATDLAWGPGSAWSADATLTQLPLALAAPLLPPRAGWSGAVDGTVHLRSGPGGTLAGTIDLAPGPGAMRYADAAGDSAALHFDRGRVTVRADAAGVQGRVALVFPGAGDLDLDARLPGFRFGRAPDAQPLSGRLRADFRDLGFVPAFDPRLANTAGVLHADLVLGGTVAAPVPAGDVTLTGGRADVPARAVQLRDITVRATRHGSGAATFQASAHSGSGTLTIDGRASAVAGPGAALHARVTGDRFLVSNTSEVRATMSPDLTLDVDAAKVTARGDVTIPSAEVHLAEAPVAVVPVSRDVVVVRAGHEMRSAAGPDIDAHLRVVLGPAVRVQAFGYEGRAEGTVVVTQSPGEPAQANGELHAVEGRYRAYGQDLTVDRGRLLFGGAVDDPRVDIRASRTAPDNVVAGVEVHGTLRQPQLNVFSTQSMGQSQAISYVLFGRPLDDVTTGQGAEASRLASALEAPAGDLLLGQIAPGLGLEGAHVTTSAGAQGPAFELGRAFSPKLYLAYSVGLLDPVSTLQLRYTLSRLWSLGAEVAARENRADIRYNVEW